MFEYTKHKRMWKWIAKQYSWVQGLELLKEAWIYEHDYDNTDLDNFCYACSYCHCHCNDCPLDDYYCSQNYEFQVIQDYLDGDKYVSKQEFTKYCLNLANCPVKKGVDYK